MALSAHTDVARLAGGVGLFPVILPISSGQAATTYKGSIVDISTGETDNTSIGLAGRIGIITEIISDVDGTPTHAKVEMGPFIADVAFTSAEVGEVQLVDTNTVEQKNTGPDCGYCYKVVSTNVGRVYFYGIGGDRD